MERTGRPASSTGGRSWRSRRCCAPPHEPNGRPALATRTSAWSRPCDSRNRRRTEAAVKTAPAVDRQLVIDVDDAAEQTVLLVVDAGGKVQGIRTRPQRAVAEPKAPEAVDLDRRVRFALQLAPEAAVSRERIDPAVSEIADQ